MTPIVSLGMFILSICLHVYMCNVLSSLAAMNKRNKNKCWHLCFWLGVIGYAITASYIKVENSYEDMDPVKQYHRDTAKGAILLGSIVLLLGVVLLLMLVL